MDICRYIDSEKTTVVDAVDITRHEYEHTYKSNLFCENENCNAMIVFNERQKRRFLRYFSTKAGSLHTAGCPNEISHKGSKGPTIKIKGNDVNVSDKHINDVLTDAYNIFYNKLNPTNSPPIKRKYIKNKQSTPKTDSEAQTVISIVSSPSSDGKGDTIIEGKEPYIYKRDVSDIKDTDRNSFKEVHALVESMRLFEDEAYIDLKSEDGIEFSVYIGLPFKASFEQEFGLLNYFENYIKVQKAANELVICTSVGEIMELNEKPVIQVYSYRHIKLNNLGLFQIIHKHNRMI